MTNNIPSSGKKKTPDKKDKHMSDSSNVIRKGPMDSESLYRRAFDVAIDGIGLLDENGYYIDTNEAYCNMLGLSYDEIIGTYAEDLIIPEEKHRLKGDYIEIIRKKEMVRLYSGVISKKGEHIPVEISGVKFEYEGRPAYLAIIHDLRERKRREAELAESEERYRILTENVTDGVIVMQGGKFKFVNNTFVEMFGLESTKNILDMSFTDLSSPGLQAYFDNKFDMFEKGDPSGGVFVDRCVSKDCKEFWVEARDKIITWGGKPAILATLRDVTENKLREIAWEAEREDLFRENITLRSTMKDRFRLGDIVGKSPAIQESYDLIMRAAASDVGVAVYGESGTGKELIARSIHMMSARKDKAFLPVNCGAIPETLFESEFFGHRKGAFTGAHRDKKGFFDIADQGTLFLDEVGELSTINQVKLLRVLDGGEYTPVGGGSVHKSDVRIIVATNRTYKDMLKNGLMREDFFYRVHIIPIYVPPLRERKEDIPLLVDHFFRKFGGGKKIETIPIKILEAMYNYDWPGNIRELQNVLQRYNTLGTIDFIDIGETPSVELADLLAEYKNKDGGIRDVVDAFEKQFLTRVLDQNRWNRGKTSELLRIPLKTLYRKMKKFDML